MVFDDGHAVGAGGSLMSTPAKRGPWIDLDLPQLLVQELGLDVRGRVGVQFVANVKHNSKLRLPHSRFSFTREALRTAVDDLQNWDRRVPRGVYKQGLSRSINYFIAKAQRLLGD